MLYVCIFLASVKSTDKEVTTEAVNAENVSVETTQTVSTTFNSTTVTSKAVSSTVTNLKSTTTDLTTVTAVNSASSSVTSTVTTVTTSLTAAIGNFNGETYEATYYYPGNGLGTSGYSGRELISGYSVASNILPMGTIIEIKGAGLDGIYRVDDKGATLYNEKTGTPVLDVFYSSPSAIPDEFAELGRVDLEVKVIKTM